MGAVGVLKPGEASDAEQALGSDLVAQATDTVSGSLMFFTPAALALKLSPYFSKIDLVHAQAAATQLHSCDMMLIDRPAARPVIAAAEQALVNAHLFASLSALKGELQDVLVADNVLRAGSLVVTLHVPGAKRAPIAPGGPPTYALAAFTVVMDYPSRGSRRNGWEVDPNGWEVPGPGRCGGEYLPLIRAFAWPARRPGPRPAS